jgi:MazG family protein
MNTQNPDVPHRAAAEALEHLLSVVAKLRDPIGGCPWDLKQTFQSLAPLVLDEGYEVADAVSEGDAELCEELGDLLSIIALFSQIATEQKRFSFASIVQGISDKLIRRHPHVFGDVKVSSTEEVLKNWEAIKQQERRDAQKEKKGLLDGLPRSMPALQRSHVIGERCATVGFDWSSKEGVADKVREELNEFLHEISAGAKQSGGDTSRQETRDRTFEEFGDLLFSLAQYGRHLGFNAEDALTAANAKFLKRFKKVEEFAQSDLAQTSLKGIPQETLEELWQKAKKTLG